MDPASALAETVARLRAVAASGRAVAADQPRQRLVDRAAGLLAGRVGCGLDQAQRHLVRLAREQGCDLVDVAVAALDALESSTTGEATTAVPEPAVRPPVRDGVDRLAPPPW